MHQSKLPEDKEEITIAYLLDGEVGYTVPWALIADEDGNLWIRGDLEVLPSPEGTASLEIRRRGDSIVVARDAIPDRSLTRDPKPPDEWLPLPVVIE